MKGNAKRKPFLFELMLSILECKLHAIKKKKKHLEKQLILLVLKTLAKGSPFPFPKANFQTQSWPGVLNCLLCTITTFQVQTAKCTKSKI